MPKFLQSCLVAISFVVTTIITYLVLTTLNLILFNKEYFLLSGLGSIALNILFYWLIAKIIKPKPKPYAENSSPSIIHVEEQPKYNIFNSKIITISGVHVKGRKAYIKKYCNEYDGVTLEHDKSNEYSDKAVSIKHDNKIIGYVSNIDINEIFPLLNTNIDAYIIEIDDDEGFLNVRLQIDIVD